MQISQKAVAERMEDGWPVEKITKNQSIGTDVREKKQEYDFLLYFSMPFFPSDIFDMFVRLKVYF